MTETTLYEKLLGLEGGAAGRAHQRVAHELHAHVDIALFLPRRLTYPHDFR